MTDKVSRTYPKFGVGKTSFKDEGTYNEIFRLIRQLDTLRQNLSGGIFDIRDVLQVAEGAKSSDPSDPDTNNCVIWQSDGTGSGDDGDIMIKVTDSSGTTKSGTLIDFSTDLT